MTRRSRRDGSNAGDREVVSACATQAAALSNLTVSVVNGVIHLNYVMFFIDFKKMPIFAVYYQTETQERFLRNDIFGYGLEKLEKRVIRLI